MASASELEKRIGALETRLEAVEATQAIQRLKARYGELVDQRYDQGRVVAATRLAELADEIASLFTPEAVWDGGAALGLCRGRAAIRERFLAPTLLFSWHFFVKPQIHVEGDRAHGTWDIFAPCTVPDGRAFWMAGVESDEYERIGGVWLHSAMRLRVIFHAPYERGWAQSPKTASSPEAAPPEAKAAASTPGAAASTAPARRDEPR